MGLGFDRLWCDGSFLTVCLLLNQGDFIPFVQNMVGRLKNSALKTYIYDQMGAGTSQSNLPLHRLQQRCHTVPQLDWSVCASVSRNHSDRLIACAKTQSRS